jgi:hypothetical protein
LNKRDRALVRSYLLKADYTIGNEAREWLVRDVGFIVSGDELYGDNHLLTVSTAGPD